MPAMTDRTEMKHYQIPVRIERRDMRQGYYQKWQNIKICAYFGSSTNVIKCHTVFISHIIFWKSLSLEILISDKAKVEETHLYKVGEDITILSVLLYIKPRLDVVYSGKCAVSLCLLRQSTHTHLHVTAEA